MEYIYVNEVILIVGKLRIVEVFLKVNEFVEFILLKLCWIDYIKNYFVVWIFVISMYYVIKEDKFYCNIIYKIIN